MPRKKIEPQPKEKSEKKAQQKTIAQLQQSDGKLYNKRGVKSIDELLGVRSNKYNTSSEKEYEEYINSLNSSDLQEHATKVGVMPNTDRNVLTKRLLKEFKISGPIVPRESGGQAFSKVPSQKVLDILAQGR